MKIYPEICILYIDERFIMKKYLLFILSLIFSAPAFAVCALTDTCAIPITPETTSNSLQNKYMPDNLNNLGKSARFSPQFVEPYDSMRMNTGETIPQYSPSNLTPQLPYNSNCQFGDCFP